MFLVLGCFSGFLWCGFASELLLNSYCIALRVVSLCFSGSFRWEEVWNGLEGVFCVGMRASLFLISFSSLESASEESSTKEMIYAFSGQVTLDEIY